MQIIFNQPIVVNDFMSFAQLYTKFRTNVCVMYCPPDHPQIDDFKWEFFRARKDTKLDFKNESDNSPAANMIFIFSTVK